MILQIRHLLNSNPARFQVCRLSDGKVGHETDGVPNPVGFPVDGWANKQLLPGLRWYLEEFLQYPFEPETTHAELVRGALRKWGELAFDSLFDHRTVGAWLEDAKKKQYADLHLQIVSDEPAILAWPWEALYDKLAGCRLANACQIERRLNDLPDPAKAQKLPKDRVNILLVIARPYDNDVRFRSIARPLVEWANRPEVPAQVHVLRPPTLNALRAHLHQNKNFYHILHFDGHGAYGPVVAALAHQPHTLQGDVQGRLVFEKDDGSPDAVSAETLTELLREGAVPAVVLNACQSAMVDERADDPFASVAAALLKAGMRSVTAMAYSLYVSAAQQFLPAFYQRLFEHGQLPDAVRAGRQRLVANNQRVCVRGAFPLEDWLVPVLYQQDAPDLRFVKKAKPKAVVATQLPEEAQDPIAKNPYGCVGRDGAFLALERALRRAPAGILVSGLGGVGKTTLVKGFLRWLEQTGGLDPARVFWFACNDIRTAEFVLNRLGERLFGPNLVTLPNADKLKNLIDVFRRERCLIVWDNFESAKGMPGTAVTANLRDEDCLLLRDLLAGLSGGATKVLITSRAPEDWLGHENRFLLKLAGLDGEERDDFANLIFHRLGKKIDRKNKDFAALMKLLNGHPLAMRVMLPKLEQHSAAALTQKLRENFAALQSTTADENEARLFATLRFATDALPEEWQPLLFLLGQHEGHVHAGLLEDMAKQVDVAWSTEKIEPLLAALGNAGMLRQVGPALWEMHPAVSGYLRSGCAYRLEEPVKEQWQHSFVDAVGLLADDLARRPLHEQRDWFSQFDANFYYARELAVRFAMDSDCAALTQALAMFAKNTFDYPKAERLFKELANQMQSVGMENELAAGFHQLGMIAKECRDLDGAEAWYRKSLEIKERLGNERGAAISYNGLGTISHDRHDLDSAEGWYRKSLEISERLGDEHEATSSYHNLGMICHDRHDLDGAEGWYRKSVEIEERLGDEHRSAITYHQLGIIAQEQRRDFDGAERWYRKSLEIKERLDDEHGAAMTYHQMGMIAEERCDFDGAEAWYRKSLAISERLGDEYGASTTYHQLGRVAEERCDFDGAERWYRKSLEIKERLGDEYGAAGSYHHLGKIAKERGDFDGAERWYRKSLEIEERLGNEYGAAITYLQFGRIAQERQDFDDAERWYRKSGVIFEKMNDLHNLSIINESLERLTELR